MIADRLLKFLVSPERRDWLPWGLAWGTTAYNTKAGVKISPDTALNFSALFNAVDILANAPKVLPLGVYKRRTDGGREPKPDHAVHSLIHRRPNDYQNPGQFKHYMQSCKLLWGNGYAEIARDTMKVPRALHPIHPSYIQLRQLPSGEILYRVSVPGKEPVDIPRRDMFHIYGFSHDGIQGLSVIAAARESLGLSIACDRFGAAFFGNGAKPGGMLEHPGHIGDKGIEHLRKTFDEMHAGPDNAHKVAILEEGMKYHPIGIPPEDAQFLETRKFQVVEVARWFNLPAYKLKDLQGSIKANIEQQSIEFVTDSLMPHLKDWEEECNRKLFTEAEAETLFCKFNVNALLRGDSVARSTYYREQWNIGALTINQICELEDRNPIGPAGDIHFVQLNMTTAEKVLEDQESEDEPPLPPPPPLEPEVEPDELDENQEAARAVLADAWQRVIRKETNAVQRAAKRYLDKGDDDGFVTWVAKFYGDYQSEIQNVIGPARGLMLRLGGVAADDFDEQAATAARQYVSTSRGQIAGLLRDTPAEKRHDAVMARVAEWADNGRLAAIMEADNANPENEN